MDSRWEIPKDELKVTNEVIGTGQYGEIKLGHWRDTKVAVKLLHGHLFRNEDQKKRFLGETVLLSKLKHKNIIHYIGYVKSSDSILLVTEFCDTGALDSYLKKNHPILITHVINFSTQIAKGLHYLHSKGYIHRDIKPPNILITEGNDVKIADMGSTTFLNTGTMSISGTFMYMAPEIKLQILTMGSGKYTKNSDIYSFGVTVYEMLHGLFKEMAEFVKVYPKVTIMGPTTMQWKKLIEGCWEADPTKRFADLELVIPLLKEINLEESQGEDESRSKTKNTSVFEKLTDSCDDWGQLISENKPRVEISDFEIHPEPDKHVKYHIELNICSSIISSKKRYSDFEKLHQQLQIIQKYAVTIPPLPSSSVFGRYSAEYVKKMQTDLMGWCNSVIILTHKVDHATFYEHFFGFFLPLPDDSALQLLSTHQLDPPKMRTLETLKEILGEKFKGIPDADLLRFLWQYDFDVERSFYAFKANEIWRERLGVRWIKISDIFLQFQFGHIFVPGSVDRQGRLIIVVKNRNNGVLLVEMVQLFVYVFEYAISVGNEFSVILDVENKVGDVRLVRELLKILRQNYPRRVAAIFVVNSSILQRTLWSVFRQFIVPYTLVRHVSLYGTQYLEAITKYIHEDQLLPEFGGKFQFNLKTWALNRAKIEGVDLEKKNNKEELMMMSPTIVAALSEFPAKQLLSDGNTIKAGYLTKQGDIIYNFKKRLFVLQQNLLFYYQNEQQATPQGFILLEKCRIIENLDLANSFLIVTPVRTWVLVAEDNGTKEGWMEVLNMQARLKTNSTAITNRGFGNPACPWNFTRDFFYSDQWVNVNDYSTLELLPADKKGFRLEYQCVEAMFYQSMGILQNKKKYTMTKIVGIKNLLLQQVFERKMQGLAKRMQEKEFKPSWDQEMLSERKIAIMERLSTFVLDQYESVKIVALWHGTSPEALTKIASNGFASIALRDQGYFGKGIYCTPQADYAASVYGSKVLLLSVMLLGNIYPVVFEDMTVLTGRSHFKNYDSHFAPVAPLSPEKQNEDVFYALKEKQEPVFDEIVTFDESHVIPRYAVFYDVVNK